MKDQVTGTLAQTASREVEEESNGYYAHHAYDLEKQPFIDALMEKSKGSLLYRMYWKKVQIIAEDILFKAIEKGKDDHNKEYKGFKWVPAKDILDSIEKNVSPLKVRERCV